MESLIGKPRKAFQTQSTSVQDSTVTVNPSLPQELVLEILLRLPVKSLLKFRSVSKSWLALISSPEFVQAQLSFASNNDEYTHNLLMHSVPTRPGLILKYCAVSSLFYEPVTEAFDLDYPMKYDGMYSNKTPCSDWIVGSVNGLICLNIENNVLFIGNPSIRKYKKLPNPRRTFLSVRSYVYGFGYDELHDDYKAVGVFYSFKASVKDEVKIYSLKSDSWRVVDDWPIGTLFGASKFLNGKLHWVTADLVPEGSYVVTFDLVDEKWGNMELPCCTRGIFSGLRVVGRHLSLLCDYESSHLDIWIMKEYGVKESWTKIFTINYDFNLMEYCPNYPLFYMSNKGEILVKVGSTSMIYNPKEESFRYSKIVNVVDADCKAEVYVESLVCPFSTEQMENATKKPKSEKNQEIE